MPYLLFILFVYNLILAKSQTIFSTSIPFRSINSCTTAQFFNSITLSCQNCSETQIPSSKKDNCKCKPGSRITGWTGGELQCVSCSQGLAVSQDEWDCVECRSSNNTRVAVNATSGQCPRCRDNEIYEIVSNSDPNAADIERCTVCTQGTQPNADSTRCETCTTAKCFCTTNPTLCNSTASLAASTIFLENSQPFHSVYISENLAFAESQCRSGQKKECQHLANMCVLQNYDRSPEGACALLESILRSMTNAPANAMPVLFYYNTEAPIELSRETAIEGIFNVDDHLPNQYLDFISVMYSLNGTFLGLEEVQGGLLQICPTGRKAEDGTFLFGREFFQQCTLKLSDLIQEIVMKRTYSTGIAETIFHELYLRYVDNNNQLMLYPIPILNQGIKIANHFVNQLDFSSYSRWLLTRRFFLIDDQKGIPNGRLIRVPSLVSFKINIQPSRNGRIFPPYLTIRHAEFYSVESSFSLSNDFSSKTLDSTFRVAYEIDSTKHDKTIEVLMAVFCSTSVLWGALGAYAWGRRAGKQIIDAYTILKLILYMTEIISNIFLLVIGCMAVWITYAYKLQRNYVYVLLSHDQEWIFITYVTVALGLKAVALFHNYTTLILTETFFVDWERPKRILETTLTPSTSDSGNQTKSEKSEQAPVVIWRTYLVANEWNELQNYRKTNVACQMFLMILLLEFLNFKDYAIVQPGFVRGDQPQEFAESRLSRFAVNLSFYLAIGLAQWIVHVLIIEKVVDPFRNFMDLCSVANISVMALTHPLRGYYIHGRSVHGLADTGMEEMNQFLKREKDNLCGLRGLESNSELQTFVMNLPRTFRDKYDEITAPVKSTVPTVNVRLSGADASTAKIENTSKVYQNLNQYLKDVIDHAVPEVDYVVSDSKFVEEVLGLELADTTKIGNFTRDPSEMAYTNVFVYGNEWPNLSFEMLLFCVIDLIVHNRIFSASITFFVAAAIQKVTRIFFTNNLIKSSFVDSRFLI